VNRQQRPFALPFTQLLFTIMSRSTSLDCSLHEPHLYDTRNGRVLRCACCGRIQIEFRHHTLLIDAEEFETLLGAVVEEMETIDANSWRLSAPTDAGTVSATFDAEELRVLHELLAGAQAMRTLGGRLQAVGQGTRRERPPTTWRL
jgi:hypothetical protein